MNDSAHSQEPTFEALNQRNFPSREGFARIPEATTPTSDTPLMYLVDLSESLRRARRPDLGKLLTSMGWLLLGGAVGAAVAGKPLENKWVMLAGVSGAILLLAGAVVWQKRIDNLASIVQRLDVHLRTMRDQAAVSRLRGYYRDSDPRVLPRIRDHISRGGGSA